MITTELIELREEIKQKDALLGKVFEEAKSGGEGKYSFKLVKCLGDDMTPDKVGERVKAMKAEIDELNQKRENLEEALQVHEDIRRERREKGRSGSDPIHPEGDRDEDRGRRKEGRIIVPLGTWFIGSDAYKMRKERHGISSFFDCEVKTLFSRDAGWDPEALRTGRVVESAQRPIQLFDIMPDERTGFDTVKYMEETTFTDNAAEVAEGAAYAEDAFALTERSVPVEKVGAFVPVSDEQLEDEPRAESYLNNRLTFTVRRRADFQILNGDGSTPNLQGILNKAGIQTQALGADPVPDAIRKSMTKVRVTGRAMPGQVVLHPNDWQDIRLLKTTEGVYIWGSPAETGPQRIWGVPVVETDAIAENTGLTGDFMNFSGMVSKRGIDVQVGFINDDFQKARKSIRADMRLALVWYRPAAFCTTTGI